MSQRNLYSHSNSAKSASRKFNSNHMYLTNKDFIESSPFVRKSYDIFTDDNIDEDIIYSRNMMNTPPEIKKKIMEENLSLADIESKKELKKNKGINKVKLKKIKVTKRRSKNMNFRLDDDTFNSNLLPNVDHDIRENVKTNLDFESTNSIDYDSIQNSSIKNLKLFSSSNSSDFLDDMNDNRRNSNSFKVPSLVIHDLREEKDSVFDENYSKKYDNGNYSDRKEDREMMDLCIKSKFQHNSSSKKNMINSSKRQEFLMINQNKYFGLHSKNKLNFLFHNSKNDLSTYPNISDLPLEKQTPRSLYMREIAKNNLLPLPLLLRSTITPFDVSLAHR